ncbi:MAG: hypothetical protein KH353_04030 [Clostridium sp.]|nr:hypothetical protein [Clostridium sp.]
MSDRKIDMTELANYIRIRQPEKEKLAELLIRAKGASRSMRQFALDCGVNPSTLSRIVNMKNSGACTDELIQKVAQNSDPESGITFEMLMDANGKVPRRMTGKYTSKEFEATEKNITDIIFKELEDRGYRTSILEGENKHNALNYRYRTDWVISTNANSDSGEMEIWEFEIWHTMLEKNSVAHTVMKLRQKFLMVLGLYYAGTMNPKKMSFVLTNREVYNRMVETLENIKFKDVFSLILVNLDENKVEEEFVFPLVGRPNVGTVFTPIEDDESKAEEDTVEETESDWEQKLFDI